MPPAHSPLTRRQLQELARLRLREAKALYKARLYDGAVYLAGYAVELALKARICKPLKITEYPESGELSKTYRTHKLEHLKLLAGVSNDIILTKNADLFNNWSTAVQWDPEQRYDPPGRYNVHTAKDIIDSITARPNGVFTWLTKRW